MDAIQSVHQETTWRLAGASAAVAEVTKHVRIVKTGVQMTSSRVRLGQSFKTVGYGSASYWGDLGAGSVEADVFYIPFIVSVQYIGY